MYISENFIFLFKGASGGAQDSTSSDTEDQSKDDLLQTDQDTIKRAGHLQEQGLDTLLGKSDMDTVRRTAKIEPPARPPRVIDSIASKKDKYWHKDKRTR